MSMFRLISRSAAPGAGLLLGLALSCLPLAAQATYIYTGQNFTDVIGTMTTSDHISLTLQLTNRLLPDQTCIDPTTLPGFT